MQGKQERICFLGGAWPLCPPESAYAVTSWHCALKYALTYLLATLQTLKNKKRCRRRLPTWHAVVHLIAGRRRRCQKIRSLQAIGKVSVSGSFFEFVTLTFDLSPVGTLTSILVHLYYVFVLFQLGMDRQTDGRTDGRLIRLTRLWFVRHAT